MKNQPVKQGRLRLAQWTKNLAMGVGATVAGVVGNDVLANPIDTADDLFAKGADDKRTTFVDNRQTQREDATVFGGSMTTSPNMVYALSIKSPAAELKTGPIVRAMRLLFGAVRNGTDDLARTIARNYADDLADNPSLRKMFLHALEHTPERLKVLQNLARKGSVVAEKRIAEITSKSAHDLFKSQDDFVRALTSTADDFERVAAHVEKIGVEGMKVGQSRVLQVDDALRVSITKKANHLDVNVLKSFDQPVGYTQAGKPVHSVRLCMSQELSIGGEAIVRTFTPVSSVGAKGVKQAFALGALMGGGATFAEVKDDLPTGSRPISANLETNLREKLDGLAQDKAHDYLQAFQGPERGLMYEVLCWTSGVWGVADLITQGVVDDYMEFEAYAIEQTGKLPWKLQKVVDNWEGTEDYYIDDLRDALESDLGKPIDDAAWDIMKTQYQVEFAELVAKYLGG